MSQIINSDDAKAFVFADAQNSRTSIGFFFFIVHISRYALDDDEGGGPFVITIIPMINDRAPEETMSKVHLSLDNVDDGDDGGDDGDDGDEE